ncbi:hypothetical protein SAY86_010642 [Trapa natans]|uniref:Uncharacterized protein n=1 Tax=Trapa natans TaxID=22666 RepID=A0AAN7LLZ7_TRANT|nr:hypothetical protein SAY86_010642 [Trapa natans]
MRGLNYNTRKRHRTTDPDLDNEDPKRQKGNNQGKRSEFSKGTNGMNLNYPTRKRDQTTDPHLDDEDPEEKRGTREAGSPLESTWDSPLLRKRQKGDNQGKSSEFPKGPPPY